MTKDHPLTSTPKIILQIFLTICPFLLYSQVTISEIKSDEEKTVSKPMSIDSLQNWEHQAEFKNYRKYIGVQIYLPPIDQIVAYGFQNSNFLFSLKPLVIKAKEKMVTIINPNLSNEKTIQYDSIATLIYKPFQCFYSEIWPSFETGICSDSSKVSNSYFTILNVLYGEELDSIFNGFRNSYEQYSKSGNIYRSTLAEEISYYSGNLTYVFLAKDDKTGDSLYCFQDDVFVFVPYFAKQKQLYQNQTLIYDGPSSEEVDIRYTIKTENGDEYKPVKVEKGSKWFCKEVTLLKPTYQMYYILTNDKNEQITLSKIVSYLFEEDYIKREDERRLKTEQLIAKRKLEEFTRTENRKKAIENHRTECIKLFGLENGELIAQGKVKIGMTTESCKMSWGMPKWTNKVTTESYIFERWYYEYGYNLQFINGILKRIEE